MLFLALCFGIFGAIIGSFLNVLVLRRGVKGLGGRSGCTSCGHELGSLDLVPIFSYLFLRGRCRYCGSRISIQYPLVEAATAILFAFFGAAPVPLFVACAALPPAALLIAIAAYDLRHTIIPDPWAFAFAGVSLLFSLAYLASTHSLSHFATLFLLAGPLSALPFAALWFISGGRWMGLGDAKLAWGVGWLLGPLYGFFAIMLSFILGALISVCVLLPLSSPRIARIASRLTHRMGYAEKAWGFTMKSEVPFGPFLAAACALVWISILYGIDPLAPLAAFPL